MSDYVPPETDLAIRCVFKGDDFSDYVEWVKSVEEALEALRLYGAAEITSSRDWRNDEANQ